MTKSLLAASVLTFILVSLPAARAQVMLDVAKITCDQFAAYKITNPQNIAMWLSGYYNGKRGNTVLDTQAMAANATKLRDYCIVNPNMLVMQAVETLFNASR
jgi:acid stress chaperone HdeB